MWKVEIWKKNSNTFGVCGEARNRLRPLKAPRLKRHHFHPDSTTHKSCYKMDLRRLDSAQWAICYYQLVYQKVISYTRKYFSHWPHSVTSSVRQDVTILDVCHAHNHTNNHAAVSEEMADIDRQHGSSGEKKKRSWDRWNVDLSLKILTKNWAQTFSGAVP